MASSIDLYSERVFKDADALAAAIEDEARQLDGMPEAYRRDWGARGLTTNMRGMAAAIRKVVGSAAPAKAPEPPPPPPRTCKRGHRMVSERVCYSCYVVGGVP